MDFISRNLEIGDSVEFELSNHSEPAINLSVLGYQPGKTLLLTAASEEQALAALNMGESCKIRWFNGSTPWLIDTQIIGIGSQPLHYIHVQYPLELQATTGRTSNRIDVELPVNEICSTKGCLPAGRIVNLSISGARVVASQPLGNEQDEITLELPANELGLKLNLKGTIRFIKPAWTQETGRSYIHGVKFCPLEPETQLAVEQLVLR